MPRYIVHHHPCADCQAKTECGGQVEENYDGCPAWICREFHLDGGTTNPDFRCEGCEAAHAVAAALDEADDAESAVRA
jgi:hypothetical protein